MDARAVLEILAALEDASVQVWLDGGWGVDALLGEQTRDHGDLDLIVGTAEVDRLRQVLIDAGFEQKRSTRQTNFVLAAPDGREVDVHAVEFDEAGYGSFELPDGRRWPFPPAAFAARGRIMGREVRCLSAEAQVQCHGQGYEPTETDLRDMELLQDRFGIVLPLALVRQASEPDRDGRISAVGAIRAKAVCVLWSSGRMLLLQAADPVDGRRYLIPPGGGVEFGERVEAAIRREIHEEVGVRISNPRRLGMLENIFRFAGQPEHELVFVYEDHCPDSELIRVEEVEVLESNGVRFPARWYTPSDAVATGLHVYPEGLLDLLHSRSRWLSDREAK